jgi:hypothetical protein
MAKPAKSKPFASEVALCAAFIAALPDGWTAYAETEGWDILLVRTADGFQIGVQAKLRLNVDVVNQAIENGYSYHVAGPGPDCRAILVPDVAAAFDKICDYVGVTIIRMRDLAARGLNPRYNSHFFPGLPKPNDLWEQWHEMAPAKRYKLPEYVPDVAAGASAPLQLTDWKIRAIKIAVLLEERGFVDRLDFKYLQIDHRRWVANGWLKVENGRFLRDACPDFRTQHPLVYEKIKADAPRWRPAAKPEQTALL